MAVLEIVAAVLVVALVVGAGVVLAGGYAVGQNAKKRLTVSPDVAPNVPTSWVGSHDPAAKLYRRVVAAVRGLRTSAEANPYRSGVVLTSVERQATNLGTQLHAASTLPGSHQADALNKLEPAVEQLESICTNLISRNAGIAEQNVQGELDALAERLRLVDEARAELNEPQTRSEPTD